MVTQIIFLSLAVVCYSIKELCIFGKIRFSKYAHDFWGSESWIRKYKSHEDHRPKFFGSTTFLVWTTDAMHLFQFLMKITLSIGIFNFTLPALYFWLGWTFLQYLTFKIASR